MDLKEVIEKVKLLKRKKIDNFIETRKQIVNEKHEIGESLNQRVYRTVDREDNNNYTPGKISKLKLMNSSIREYEEWDHIRKNAQNYNSINWQDLAYCTHKKEISQLQKSKIHPSGKVTKSQLNRTNKVLINDNKALVTQLSDNLRKTTKKRYLEQKKQINRNKNQTTSDRYINEKNKIFNEKLEKQFKKVNEE